MQENCQHVCFVRDLLLASQCTLLAKGSILCIFANDLLVAISELRKAFLSVLDPALVLLLCIL